MCFYNSEWCEPVHFIRWDGKGSFLNIYWYLLNDTYFQDLSCGLLVVPIAMVSMSHGAAEISFDIVDSYVFIFVQTFFFTSKKNKNKLKLKSEFWRIGVQSKINTDKPYIFNKNKLWKTTSIFHEKQTQKTQNFTYKHTLVFSPRFIVAKQKQTKKWKKRAQCLFFFTARSQNKQPCDLEPIIFHHCLS